MSFKGFVSEDDETLEDETLEDDEALKVIKKSMTYQAILRLKDGEK